MNTEISTNSRNDATWGFQGTLIWGVIISLAFVATQSIVIGLFIALQYQDVPAAEYAALVTSLQYDGMVLSLCTFATLVVCSCLMFGIIRLKRNSSITRYLGLQPASRANIKYWFLVVIALLVCSDLLTLLVGKSIVPEFMSSAYASIESKWILWVALIVAAPLFEELFFRGFVISGLSTSFVGTTGAILISSAAWAAVHLQYDLYGMATIFIFGLVLGTARVISGSVLLTVGLHSFINLVATTETALFIA